MPSGIILSSGSQGATQEAIEKVLADNGYEPDQAENKAEEPVEPKREEFATDEEFAEAQEAFESAQEEREEAEAQKTEKEQAKQPKPSRKQRAIDRATRQLQEELRQTRERLAALEGKGKGAEAAAAAVEAEVPQLKLPPKPKEEDFKTPEEYDEAMFEWRYKVRRAKEVQEEALATIKAEREEHWSNYKSRVAEFAAAHDDFDEVVNDKIQIHEAVYEAIVRLESPEVSYYLGKHPDYAQRLAAMEPFSAAMEVARLAERLKTGARATEREAGGGAPKKPAPKLPEPVKPLQASAPASTLTSRDAAQQRNYKAFKAAQRRGV